MLANQRLTPSSSEPIRRRINEIHKTGAERGKIKGATAIDWENHGRIFIQSQLVVMYRLEFVLVEVNKLESSRNVC